MQSIKKIKKFCRKPFFGFLIFSFLSAFHSSSTFALDRDRSLTQFHHTAWTAKDGAPSQITALAQTTDGFLWIGSTKGLFRFDGVEFEPYISQLNVSLPANNITSLLATNDGGLWIVFRSSGLGFLKNGNLKVFSTPEELPKSDVFCLTQDLEGRIWAGTLRGLALFDGARWHEISNDWNVTNQRVWSMFVDHDGTLWVAMDNSVVFLPRGSKTFQHFGIRTTGITQIIQAMDGQLWVTGWNGPVQPMPDANHKTVDKNIGIQIKAYNIHFDRDGSLWMVDGLNGITRVKFPEKLTKDKYSHKLLGIESFSTQDGLTSISAGNILEDREGNIWVGSIKGLDRFSYSPLVSVGLPSSYTGLTLLTRESGDIWVGSGDRNSLLQIIGEKIIKKSKPMEVASVYRGSDGNIWWGGSGGIWKQKNESFKFYPQPIGVSAHFWEIFPADDSGSLWTRMGDSGLIHFDNGVWNKFEKPKGLPEKGPSAAFKDSQGRIWLGYSNGNVSLMHGKEIKSFSRNDGLEIGKIKVIRGRGERIWFGGEHGLTIFDNGLFKKINTFAGSFGSISGIVETADGTVWLNEMNGIVCIPAEEIHQLLNNPDYQINYRQFNILDGMPGGAQMNTTVSTAAETTDGRIWFATDNGLVWINPANIMKNNLPPPVVIKSLTTDEKTYQLTELLELPKGTENLRIKYTALSLSVPERVRFKYRLEGIDKDWRDAGTQREAFYTNPGPGLYRFRVIASNNDGVWNEEGAEFEFIILPMFYQTNWFLALCTAVFLFLVFIGYKWRVRRVKNRLQWQFEERLAERTLIAQDLHDTILQGFVSAKMQLFAELQDLPSETLKTKRLKGVYSLLGQLIEDGRKTVKNLRASEYDDFINFEQEFLKVREAFDFDRKIDFRIFSNGTPPSLNPQIGSELLQIGHEALINAFLHSQATAIEIEIEYGLKSLNLSVRDNGCGIDPKILHTGREDHWGLTGMRERAEKIKAEIKILSRIKAGTEIVVSVPRKFAYKNAGLFQNFKRKFVLTIRK